MAGCTAALAVAAHAAAGGGLPSTGVTVVLTVLLAGAGVALADRRRGFAAILGLVAGSQLGMHVLLDNLAHAHAPGTAAVASPGAMFATHTAAALVIAVLLAGAEAAVFACTAVLRWLLSASGVLALSRPPNPHARPRPAEPPAAPPARSFMLDVLLRRVHARRGPPALS